MNSVDSERNKITWVGGYPRLLADFLSSFMRNLGSTAQTEVGSNEVPTSNEKGRSKTKSTGGHDLRSGRPK